MALLLAAPTAAAVPTASGGDDGLQSGVPVVKAGDYCGNTYGAYATVGQFSDGATAYCVRVAATDAWVWSRTSQMMPVDPHNRVHVGDGCFVEGAMWTDYRSGWQIFCRKTVNGRMRGDLRWQF
ncbi:hypothetical protein ACFV4K_17885 [Nocardia sp. NPDC059764]|uniref:hypothetical protein n=1 Tax=Nocardia sp. NPDC059764 TaxID=3346939 RepID=UPI0036551809